MILTAWFDLSSADAAQALGITPAAFRMRTTRARRRLRRRARDTRPPWSTHSGPRLNDDLDARLRASRPVAAVPDPTPSTPRFSHGSPPPGRPSLPLPPGVRRRPSSWRPRPLHSSPPSPSGWRTGERRRTRHGIRRHRRPELVRPAGGHGAPLEEHRDEGRTDHPPRVWQSADDPDQPRFLVDAGAGHVYELGGPGKRLYDPQTNTIYDAGDKAGAHGEKATLLRRTPTRRRRSLPARRRRRRSLPTRRRRRGPTPSRRRPTRQRSARRPRPAQAGSPGCPTCGRGGRPGRVHGRRPEVAKIRYVLQEGQASVTGSAVHNGVDAWVISLNATPAARPGRSGWTGPTGARSSSTTPAATPTSSSPDDPLDGLRRAPRRDRAGRPRRAAPDCSARAPC